MVPYSDFDRFSVQHVTQDEYAVLEQRAVDILQVLCGSRWTDSEATRRAVMYQVEFILQLGGLDAWSEGAGSLQSRSYSVGGESESITYMQSFESGSGRKTFNGLAIAPMAWALLHSSGFVSRLGRVRTW